MKPGDEGLNKPERPTEPTPETGPETGPVVEIAREVEREAEGAEAGEGAKEPKPAEPALQVAVAQDVPVKEISRDPLLIEVEGKLADGLWDAYKSMSPGVRAKFKAEGERIAHVAREGVASGKIAAESLLTMIIDWLKMIPHVDRWFLMQDAKLKTDALIRMSKEQDQE